MCDPNPRPGGSSLRLTEAHVRAATRIVEGPLYDPRWRLLDDGDLDRLTATLTDDRARPIPIFAYGSLIWNPGFAVGKRQRARAIGWHRSFNIPLDHFRGSPEQPGLMLALASGGNCDGLILEVAPGTEAESMRAVLARELVVHELAGNTRWITVETDQGASQALTFYADPVGFDLVDLPLQDQAVRLARANGVGGSGCEYLLRTAQGLEAEGIHDPYIWELQDLVAAEIDSWTR